MIGQPAASGVSDVWFAVGPSCPAAWGSGLFSSHAWSLRGSGTWLLPQAVPLAGKDKLIPEIHVCFCGGEPPALLRMEGPARHLAAQGRYRCPLLSAVFRSSSFWASDQVARPVASATSLDAEGDQSCCRSCACWDFAALPGSAVMLWVSDLVFSSPGTIWVPPFAQGMVTTYVVLGLLGCR